MSEVSFLYRNHKGGTRWRRVEVESLEFIEKPGFDYQPGWFLNGRDLDLDARRSFRLSNIVLQFDNLRLELSK